ncbi:MAG: DUF2442 domain-containing protein [Clostridiales Family XIII bacterium]|jgi:hypothetical protein|nr:DUF2442 domain-containing protein [Clostridiales Family XIII bacterium]
MIRPRAIEVEPMNDYKLFVTFANQEKRIFDVKPYRTFPSFKDVFSNFNSVHIAGLSVAWENGVDICPDELYFDSFPAGNSESL